MTKSKEIERKEWEYLPVYRRDENSFELSMEINSPGGVVPEAKKIQFQGLPAETTTGRLMIQKGGGRDKTGHRHREVAEIDKIITDETNTRG